MSASLIFSAEACRGSVFGHETQRNKIGCIPTQEAGLGEVFWEGGVIQSARSEAQTETDEAERRMKATTEESEEKKDGMEQAGEKQMSGEMERAEEEFRGS